VWISLDNESDDDLSTGAILSVPVIAAFVVIIALVAVVLIIITYLYCKHIYKPNHASDDNVNHNKGQMTNNDPTYAEIL